MQMGMCILVVSKIAIPLVQLETLEKMTLAQYGFPRNTKTLEEISKILMREDKLDVNAINLPVSSTIDRSMRFCINPTFCPSLMQYSNR